MRGFRGGVFIPTHPSSARVFLWVGVRNKLRDCIRGPSVPSRKWWQRRGQGTGTFELPRLGLAHNTWAEGETGAWSTQEAIAVVIARAREGAAKAKAPRSAAVSDHSQTMIDFSVLHPGEQALF